MKDNEIKELQRKIEELQKTRIELSSCLKESGTKILKDKSAQIEFTEKTGKEKEIIIEENRNLKKRITDLENEKIVSASNMEKIMKYINLLEADIKTIKANLNNESDMVNTLKRLNGIIKELQEKNKIVIMTNI